MRRTLLVLMLSSAMPAAAQRGIPGLSAESGVYAEAYDIDNRPARRPTQSMRFYTSPTFAWLGLEVGTMITWSTEDAFAAQTLNRYYVNPRWSWGQLHAGDYTPVMSRFTASAVRVRGGGVELSPGRFRVMLAGGLAQDATDLSAFDAAPRRVMYSGLVGYGDPARSFIELSALRAIDDSSGADSLSVAPQENVVGTLAAGLTLGRLRLRGEGGASLFSRDIRASELDSMSQPAATDGVFTPRLSSRLDGAYSAGGATRSSIRLRGRPVRGDRAGIHDIGESVPPQRQARDSCLGRHRLFRGRLAGSGSVGARSDNLAGDKRGTTTRRTGAFGLTMVNGSWLVSSASVLLNALTRDPPPVAPGTPDPGIVDSFRVRNVSRSVSLVEQTRFDAAGLPHTITLSVSAQNVDDASPRFGNTLDASATSVVADWSVTFAQQLSLSLRPGYERFQGGGRDEAYGSLGAGVTRRAPRSRWTAGLLATRTQVQDGSQWRATANAGLRVTTRDQLTVGLRHSRVRGVAQPFAETLVNMRLTRRW